MTLGQPHLDPRGKSEPWVVTERTRTPSGLFVTHHRFQHEKDARAFVEAPR